MRPEQVKFYLTIASATMLAGVAFYIIYELAMNAADATWVTNIAYIAALLSPMLAFLVARRSAFWIQKGDSAFKSVLVSLACIGGVVGTNIIFSIGKTTFQVVAWDLLFFYVSIGVAEEILYRLLVVNVVIAAFTAKNKAAGALGAVATIIPIIWNSFVADTTMRLVLLLVATGIGAVFLAIVPRRDNRRSIAGDVTGVIVSALTFSLAHLQVYGVTAPEMLVATFITGAIMAACYVYTRDIAVAIGAHAVNNLMASIHLVLASL